jgi:glycosyltransferase involved in cell wall biosynthesis
MVMSRHSMSNGAKGRSRAVALLRSLTHAGGHPVIRRLYDLVPLRWKDALRARLIGTAGGATHGAARPVIGRPAPPNTPPLRVPTPDDGRGVNLIGFAHGALGLSENFRSLARALLAEGYAVSLVDAGVLDSVRNSDRAGDLTLSSSAPYPIDIFCINPDQLGAAMDATRLARRSDAYRIGYWFWELETIPADWIPALDHVDEIWVASPFVRDAFTSVTHKPVILVRVPVEPPVLPGRGKDEGAPFVFLFSFDFHSYVARKNPAAVIEAFTRAFPQGDENVRLVVKSNNGDAFREQLYALLARASCDARVRIVDGYVPREQMLDLLDAAEVYVSLHRSEGFGLGMAEAMALGKAVIGTGYSGNLEFMDGGNSRLVRFKMVAVRPGEYMHGEGCAWAEPDVDHAATLMRELAADSRGAIELGRRAAEDMKLRHSMSVAGRIAVERLTAIRQMLPATSDIPHAASPKQDGSVNHPGDTP